MVMTNQWSVEITRHVLVTVQIAWNFGRCGTKKVPGTVPSGKPCKKGTVLNCTVPYHAVEKRHKCQFHLCVLDFVFSWLHKLQII